jgi:hypothetical protein
MASLRVRYPSRTFAPLDRSDRWCRSAQVLRGHHRMGLYGRVQSEQKGFPYSGDLGGVAHVDDEVSAPCAFHNRKVRRLGLDLLTDGLNTFAAPPSRQAGLPWSGRHCAFFALALPRHEVPLLF